MPQFVQAATATGQYTPAKVVQFLRSVQGYDLAGGQVPDPTLVTIVKGAHDNHPGRSLSSSDAGTGNVLVPLAASRAPDNLRLGDTLTLTGTAASGVQSPVTLTIVGFYTSNLAFGNILVDAPIVQQVGGGDPSYVYTLYLNPQSAQSQLGQIQSAVPSVWIFNIADTLTQVNDLINNLMTLLVIIASLTMLAAIIGIANAVALALLERRRELGILKAVGFTSRTVIGEVLVENALIGVVAAMLAVVWVCIVIPTLGLLLTGQPFSVPVPLAGAIILGSTVLSMVVAAVIAWRPTRVRPMEVLRYE
jgi:predicted lysophospholipase L1 biosynthesis ABC-type transport system permease subunit